MYWHALSDLKVQQKHSPTVSPPTQKLIMPENKHFYYSYYWQQGTLNQTRDPPSNQHSHADTVKPQ